MTNALIGFTGFVVSTLMKQKHFESLYRSTNIGEIEGQSYRYGCLCRRTAQNGIVSSSLDAGRDNMDGDA